MIVLISFFGVVVVVVIDLFLVHLVFGLVFWK